VFVIKSGRVRFVKFVRAKPIYLPKDDASFKIGERLKSSCVGFHKKERNHIHREVLLRNKTYVVKSQVSLKRGHGVNVPWFVLADCGLKEREETYLSLPSSFDRFPTNGRLPDGFVRVRSESAAVRQAAVRCQSDLAKAFVEEAWNHEDTPSKMEQGPITVPICRIVSNGIVDPVQEKSGRRYIQRRGMPELTRYKGFANGVSLLSKFGGSDFSSLGRVMPARKIRYWDEDRPRGLGFVIKEEDKRELMSQPITFSRFGYSSGALETET
jgi:hypothetical protein